MRMIMLNVCKFVYKHRREGGIFVTNYVDLRVRLARSKTGLSPPVKYFTDRSKAVLLLWIIFCYFCFVFVMHSCASVY